MFSPEHDHRVPAEDSPWIRRCCSEVSSPGTTAAETLHDNESQVLLCCQHNGRFLQGPHPDHKCLFPSAPKSTYLLIQEQFIRFCQNTSLRGVPRIVKAKDRKLRVLWTIFFLIFLIGCFVGVVLMVRQYLDHAMMERPSTISHKPMHFPSITVCNTRPFSIRGYNLLKSQRIMTPREYRIKLMHKFVRAMQKYKIDRSQKVYLSNAFLISMFLQALPKSIKASELGHRLDEMILDCNVMLMEGSIMANRPCQEVGAWSRTFNELFLNCYTLTIPKPSISKTTMKVNMTIYLGERIKDCPDCSGSFETQLDGARLQIHEASTYPTVNEGGMYLSPGKLTEIEFTTKEIHMKEPPVGACKEDQPKNITLDEQLFTFSRSACFISELQRKIVRDCHCLSAEKPVPGELRLLNKPFCRTVVLSPRKDAPIKGEGMDDKGNYKHDFLKKFIKRVKCKIDTESEYALEHKGCPKRCITSEFESTISSTNWPTRSYQDNFIDKVKSLKEIALEKVCRDYSAFNARNRSLLTNASDSDAPASRYSIDDCVAQAKVDKNLSITDVADLYDGILKWKKPKTNSSKDRIEENLNRMLRDEFFSDHLISLIVRRPHFGIKLIEENEVMTLTNLLSLIGGIIGMSIGLNCSLIVEIIELIYNIFQSIRKYKPQK